MDEIKINKKTLIIVSIALITVLLIGSLIFLINKIPLVSAAGTCSGSPATCRSYGEACPWNECAECTWEGDIGQCLGIVTACDQHTTESVCNGCGGCTWTAGPENFYINVADSWLLAQDVYVNVGDVWQDAEAVYVNVGDVWRLIYSA